MKASAPVHILLADDDMDDRFFFERAVNALPFPTRFAKASDGEKLMQHLKKNLRQLPDVIFLDLNMPRKNGNECLLELKADIDFRNIPVIIYSTSLITEVTNVLYENGAHYFIQKCDFPQLVNCLSKAIELLLSNKEQGSKSNFIISMTEIPSE